MPFLPGLARHLLGEAAQAAVRRHLVVRPGKSALDWVITTSTRSSSSPPSPQISAWSPSSARSSPPHEREALHHPQLAAAPTSTSLRSRSQLSTAPVWENDALHSRSRRPAHLRRQHSGQRLGRVSRRTRPGRRGHRLRRLHAARRPQQRRLGPLRRTRRHLQPPAPVADEPVGAPPRLARRPQLASRTTPSGSAATSNAPKTRPASSAPSSPASTSRKIPRSSAASSASPAASASRSRRLGRTPAAKPTHLPSSCTRELLAILTDT